MNGLNQSLTASNSKNSVENFAENSPQNSAENSAENTAYNSAGSITGNITENSAKKPPLFFFSLLKLTPSLNRNLDTDMYGNDYYGSHVGSQNNLLRNRQPCDRWVK